MIYRKIAMIVSTAFILSSCATAGTIEENYRKIDYEDGLSKSEIITIAKRCMINSKLDQNYQLWTASAEDEGDYWRVVFSSVYFNHHACVLIMKKEDGEILAFYEAKDWQETFEGRRPHRSVDDWKRLQKFD